jgi:hypothetical protein
MDKKLANAINRGRKAVLEEFVNIDPNNPGEGLLRFFRNYGALFPGLDGVGKREQKGRSNQEKAHSSSNDQAEVRRYHGPMGHEGLLHFFRGAWTAKAREDLTAVAEVLEGILNRRRMADVPPPKLSVDHRSLQISIVPDTLLDLMVKWWMESPTWQLGTCELRGCPHRYYLKEHPRDRYCSIGCTHEADRLKKLRWSRKSRGVTEAIDEKNPLHTDYAGVNDLENEFAPSKSEEELLRLVSRARKIRWPVRSRNKTKLRKGK